MKHRDLGTADCGNGNGNGRKVSLRIYRTEREQADTIGIVTGDGRRIERCLDPVGQAADAQGHAPVEDKLPIDYDGKCI
jgi:hypothetical protein